MNLDYSSPVAVDRRGIMLIISSPSGVGKSTIANQIIQSDHNFTMSVSVTTRDCRPDEVDGKDYHFLGLNNFVKLQKENSFIEWAEVHGNFYGTLRNPIEKTISQGRDMLFDIDWQGSYNLQKRMRSDIVSFFILPPTMRELRSRLSLRAEKNREGHEAVQLRLANAYLEIKQWDNYDYVIVNDDLETTLRIVKSVIEVERMRRGRLCRGISDFVGGLLGESLD
ncbi:MAG: guanylate kinase [Candidatus Liberibacter europaeus]|uniref:Guanylate kinase n=1 Tax=Candidatus Liberibacter europaeus TaxID=744859 RepID=A0A2T4VWC9_9HYPH|nr:guanylate kinase [Candidatus Liberibacter europaeus]PTL86086.1 MAG: guanylate kinase [Candidatus Liberibacter europaeus]